MKKIAIMTATLCALCRITSAGSASDKNFQPSVPAPASLNWTGFYIGAFAGYKHSTVDSDLSLGGVFNAFPSIKNPLEARGSEDLDNDGAELGGLLGFNYQVRQWVFGLEATGGYLWARRSNDTVASNLGLNVPPIDIRTSFKTHYLVTIAPRIGYAWGRLLPYVTGGLAIGDLDWSQRIRALIRPTADLGGHTTQTNAGWMAGGGLQYALTNHWSARLQYQFVDLGSASFDRSVITVGDFRSHHEVSLVEHNASFALIYQF